MTKKRKPARLNKPRTKGFDKYATYQRAVQAADTDVLFIRDTYKEVRGKNPVSLREDFCGTFSICCEWTKLGPQFQATGIDVDAEPIEYGRAHNLPMLTPTQQSRVQIEQADVLNPGLPKS